MGKFDKYTADVRQVLTYAREEAQRLRHRLVGPEHLLSGLLKLHDPLIDGLFAALHISTLSISQALDFVVGHGNKAILSEPTLSVPTRATLARAEEEAASVSADGVAVEHLFLALLTEQNGIATGVLESFGVSLDAVRAQLVTLAHGGYEHLLLTTQYHARYAATPTLNQVSRDLTVAALNGSLDPMIGREAELERTMQILSRRSKNNPVLIGPAGVGKTAIAEALALRIIQGTVPENLLRTRVVALEVGLLSVGTRFRGDFEERLKRILQEVTSTPGIIIIIDELHTLVQTGVAEGSLDASSLFKPMLARGEFQCIGATTFDEYRKTIEADPALERRFQPVQISESSPQDTLAILQGLRSRYEAFHHVQISDEALQAAVDMSSRYIQNRFQPDKSLDLVDEAASRVCVQLSIVPDSVRLLREEIVRVQQAKEYLIIHRDFSQAAQLLRRERQARHDLWQTERAWLLQHEHTRPCVGVQDIAAVVSYRTGIPTVQVAGDESLRLLNLENDLHQRIVGQQEAVHELARAVRRSRTNLRDRRRPIGSFIFVGPTGVGKTELARALAASLFGDENAMLKIDMSEFMESHNASRLIGSPPGYVGYNQAGQLTESVRRRPYSIVLFDEIEKAHPKIFDLLLQILEDGCLTDAQGQIVDFKHTLIILTSNVGTTHLTQHAMSFTTHRDEQTQRQNAHTHMRDRITRALQDVFRPELLNRIDSTIVFHRLEPAHVREITDLMLAQTQQRLLKQDIQLHISDAARTFLAIQGYDAEYGARPLRRTIQRLLEDMLAETLLRGTCQPGDTVCIDVQGNTQLCFSVASPQPALAAVRDAHAGAPSSSSLTPHGSLAS